LLLTGVFATTSPTIFKYFVGVLAFDVTTMVLLNAETAAALFVFFFFTFWRFCTGVFLF
jgi:hypothetical protein